MAKSKEKFDTVTFFIEYESGECSDDQIINGFQHLVDSGLAWQLQGSYGRMATQLIEAGLVKAHRTN
jgi:hypothetical protein